jgi:hypothetical protein
MSEPSAKPSHRWGKPSCRVARGYGPLHIKLRRQLLREEPNCRVCADLGVETKGLRRGPYHPQVPGRSHNARELSKPVSGALAVEVRS